MASHRPRPPSRVPDASARDAGLRRLSALNRLAVAGAAVLALGFTALAAQATPAQRTATVAAHARVSTPQPAAPAQTQTPTQAPAVAPARTQQPPVAVSGGS